MIEARERDLRYVDTSGSVSGATFVLMTVKHALTPVGDLPAVGPASHEVHTRPGLVKVWTALTPQRPIRQHEPRPPLYWQKLRVVYSTSNVRPL